jgi:N-acetylglucosaminyl-diphospho-decaprenol L-rhamnosyltransferase
VSVSVVIVSFRTPALLAGCLEQLAAEASVREVVVVDNASADGSAELVEERFPHVRLIRNTANVGFARAVNQGLPFCSGEYLLLLNPDTVVEKGAIDALVRLLISDPAVAAAGPAIHHPTGRLKVLSGGRQPTVWRMFTHATMLSRLSRTLPFLEGVNLLRGIHDDRPRDVDWLTGACLMLRREAFAAVGGLSERWFMYAEDFELCLRLRRSGWRLVHLPSARIAHYMGASADAGKPQSTAWAVTLHDFYRTDICAGPVADLTWRAVFASQLLSRSLYYTLKSRQARRSSDPASASAWLREATGFATSARSVLRGERPGVTRESHPTAQDDVGAPAPSSSMHRRKA